MLSLSPATRVFVAVVPVDGRKSFNGQRMLSGPKSERMTQEQAAELEAVVGDLAEQEQRPATDGEELLQEEAEPPPAGQEPVPRSRRKPRQVPAHLEVETAVLEPAEAVCPECKELGEEIGRDVTEEVDLIPARLIVRRTVRIKRKCRCGCGGIAIAPLPPPAVACKRARRGAGGVHPAFQVRRSPRPLHPGTVRGVLSFCHNGAVTAVAGMFGSCLGRSWSRMRILLDECVPWPIHKVLSEYEPTAAQKRCSSHSARRVCPTRTSLNFL